MKKFIFLAVIVATGYLAYTNFFQTSAEEKLVSNLEKEFQTATQNYIAANRQAAEPGLVAITDPEKAERQVKEVRKKLKELLPTLTDDKAIARAQELEAKIQNFCQKNEIE
jgi:ABC-type lipoprotein release transport system permease subunit